MHRNMSQSVTNVYNMIHKRKHNDIFFVYIMCDTLTHKKRIISPYSLRKL